MLNGFDLLINMDLELDIAALLNAETLARILDNTLRDLYV
jgi:hypothetical protein